MLPRPLRAIWGDLSNEELKKFGILSSIFFMIIGVYWMLKTVKDGVFGFHVDIVVYQPWAKLASLIFVGLMVMFYSKLVDLFKKTSVFYIICGFYGIGLLLLSYLLNHHQLFAPDGAYYSSWLLGWIPGNVLGWATYLFIESFGSILPALFWAFVASTTTADSAKRGYAMVVTLGQVGTILGPLIISEFGRQSGLPLFFMLAGLIVMVVPFFIKWYSKHVPAEEAKVGNKGGTGFFEGVRLLFSHRYLMGIFAVATLYEFIGTILDYQMKVLTDSVYSSKIAGGADFARFQGWYGASIGVLSLLFAMFGTSYFMRKLGLRFCLVAFPAVIGVSCLTVFFGYNFGLNSVQLLWTFFGAMVAIKGMNYALNNPTRDVLYIPTSKDVKFKTKGWIDAFGARALKGCGAGVTSVLSYSKPLLLSVGTILSLGVIGGWIFIAFFVGDTFDQLQQDEKIVE